MLGAVAANLGLQMQCYGVGVGETTNGDEVAVIIANFILRTDCPR